MGWGGIRDPGKKPIPDPGVKKATGSRIRDPQQYKQNLLIRTGQLSQRVPPHSSPLTLPPALCGESR